MDKHFKKKKQMQFGEKRTDKHFQKCSLEKKRMGKHFEKQTKLILGKHKRTFQKKKKQMQF